MKRKLKTRIRKKRARRPGVGSSPGLIRVDPEAPKPTVRAMLFGPDSLVEEDIEDPARLRELRGGDKVLWVDVHGLGDAAVIEELGNMFSLHPLALEDTVNTHQRPKVEEYENEIYVVLRMPESPDSMETEQVSMYVGRDFVLTFQERPGDCLDPVRERIRAGRPRIRTGGPDYIAYAIYDAVVDAYFPILDHVGEQLEGIEEEVLGGSESSTVARLHTLRRRLVVLRRIVWPTRDALSALLREESDLVEERNRVYWRDCYDHCVQLMDLTESYRDSSSSIMDLYLSMVSNRMNEVMKVLTLIATMFIPLTFVAGIYGMNFDPDASRWNMPELAWKYGYPAVWGVMIVMAILMLIYFKRKRWL